jgi:uncharacterized Fe-S cluster protein YjdI
MSEKEIIKEYSNDDITIVWKPNTCIHSTKCWKGLISVFNPKKRPWIDPQGADTETIINQVQACPSGALSFYYNNEAQKEKEQEAIRMEVKVAAGGPLLVAGEVKIIHKKTEAKRCVRMQRSAVGAFRPISPSATAHIAVQTLINSAFRTFQKLS